MRVGNRTRELQLEVVPFPSPGQQIKLWRNISHSQDFKSCGAERERPADGKGSPKFGAYRGLLPEVDLTRLRGPYAVPPTRRWFKHKRCQYGMISARKVMAVFSELPRIADLP